jgi:translation initiation factor 1 (eIF-1/SUI1)
MDSQELLGAEWVDAEQKKTIEKLHQAFRSGGTVKEKQIDAYGELMESVLLEKIEH